MLKLTPEEAAFCEEVRAFCAQTLTPSITARVRAGMRPTPADWLYWQAALHAKGWGAPTWPREAGGTGWSHRQIYLFDREVAACDGPPQFHQGLELIGPIIYAFGSEALKSRLLPRILSGEDWWCQGYSEPGAGSDLASLRTRAERVGDHYVVNGQKLWTSYAQHASMMFCLVRTESGGSKQSGISLLLVDMKTPGIRVQPIRTLDEQHHVNEVFLDDVHVPVENLVGEEGKGWSYGKVLLDRERAITISYGPRLLRQLAYVREAAAQVATPTGPLLDEPVFQARIAQLEIEILTLEAMGLRTLEEIQEGLDSGPRGSMMKIRWSELLQTMTELWVEALGSDAERFARPGQGPGEDDTFETAGPMLAYLHGRVTTIYGGSNEIQRNIIGRRALGL
ncbi:acyl-CoA dehydrogenase family protein [Verticiella alkaliphila]|uniref:acyl-CoA dehydrogenase family protein n=1 Tax=Verticiella alkaliphila TaxID=2779529 RepID=UPI00209A8DC3|nr:acyl-CoA dehydrogenase family protein [Verticiella sp. GG226]